QIGYHPSVAARSLKTNRSQALGVIVSHIADPFFSEILQGIDDVAQSNGYSLFIAAAQHDSAREEAILQTMREHRVDGVILCSPQLTAERIAQLQSFKIPIVAINNQGSIDFQYSISHDDVDGSRQACQHLIGMGHRKIGYLGDANSGRTTRDRLLGYQQVMLECGLPVPFEFIHEASGNSATDGLSGVGYFLRLEKMPTAIICYNDMVAAGALKGLHLAGLKVPDDISVTGFDNILYSDYTQPPLTTIDQPKRFLGAEAARLMFQQLVPSLDDAPSASFSKKLKGTLLIRQSTAPPAGEKI
ncbi:MAG TPA: LacI family DNA-binding transcriptional regulator, partial [Saprospiraceae bacterium]|nr:LacI family DNA-binding transcriptional regulator [Saprospiraceae bacterium]